MGLAVGCGRIGAKSGAFCRSAQLLEMIGVAPASADFDAVGR
jgi:hypothetical protein